MSTSSNDKGTLPKACPDVFKVKASGKTRKEAKDNTLAAASNICKKVLKGKGCPQATEVGKGKVTPLGKNLFSYSSEYICARL
jgi:hypothetical protein